MSDFDTFAARQHLLYDLLDVNGLRTWLAHYVPPQYWRVFIINTPYTLNDYDDNGRLTDAAIILQTLDPIPVMRMSEDYYLFVQLNANKHPVSRGFFAEYTMPAGVGTHLTRFKDADGQFFPDLRR
jgi:hypothetical protein